MSRNQSPFSTLFDKHISEGIGNRFTQQQPVTLRDLLNHSADINIHGFNGYAQGEAVPSLLQVLDGAPPANSEPVRVEAIPGTEWKYSGGGYTVVQLMMAEACGKLFPELMQELVLGPLDMKDSTFATTLPPIWKTRAGIGHHTKGEPVSGGWHTGRGFLWENAGWRLVGSTIYAWWLGKIIFATQ
ncbi:serine hydrolase [Stenotrophomonas sp. SY1]|uniref:serine hydrolase n=1 Tax=Stenotrophomonas sp. SY1 TaxID=477235 RepID=UPI001E295C30|nr:serine hydrolase [Stenotrophomonas sp. SY1]MCD9088696.1 serine hydrolase [Stenotrophomonas sp. SY1]